jgi:16S rRNA (uracil1498-N3)-methyltransferase
VDLDAKGHAFVLDLDNPALEPDDQHHLARVLRLRTGATITVADGHGAWRRCTFGDELEPIGPVEHDPEPAPALTVAFAVVKGERTEWAVQKLAELGVDRIVPLVTERSVVRWDGPRAAHQHERLQRIARSAAMQSRRSRLPTVEPLTPFAEITDEEFALADPAGSSPSLLYPSVAIGPEGGWSETERGRGRYRVRLAATVLRTETAAVAAGALLTALRADLITSPQGTHEND